MPRKYVRKADAKPRGTWTEEDLLAAFEELKEKKCSFASVSQRYGIPSRTLIRRFKKQDATKLTLGKHPLLDFQNEDKIAKHIKKLEEVKFPVTRKMMRRLAYELAEYCGIDHNFDAQTKKAGIAWLRSFIDRHPDLGVRRSDDLTIASHGLSREQVDKMSEDLIQVLTKNDLLAKPECTTYKMNKNLRDSCNPKPSEERKDDFECVVFLSHLVTIDLSVRDKNSDSLSSATKVKTDMSIEDNCLYPLSPITKMKTDLNMEDDNSNSPSMTTDVKAGFSMREDNLDPLSPTTAVKTDSSVGDNSNLLTLSIAVKTEP